MQKAETPKANVISIARAGDETKKIAFVEGMRVSEALSKAGITLGSSEEIYVEAEKAENEDILQAGDLVQIVGKKDGGSL